MQPAAVPAVPGGSSREMHDNVLLIQCLRVLRFALSVCVVHVLEQRRNCCAACVIRSALAASIRTDCTLGPFLSLSDCIRSSEDAEISTSTASRVDSRCSRPAGQR